MVSVIGTYQNGFVKLDKEYTSENPVKVIVTFLEEMETANDKGFDLSDFSFAQSQDNLKNYEGNLSDDLINERSMDL